MKQILKKQPGKSIDKVLLLFLFFFLGTLFGALFGNIITLQGLNTAMRQANLSLCVIQDIPTVAKFVYNIEEDEFVLDFIMNASQIQREFGENIWWNRT
jgi:hypothetical protein